MAPKDSAEVRVPDPGSWEVPCVLDKLPPGLCPGAAGPGFNTDEPAMSVKQGVFKQSWTRTTAVCE